MTIIPAESTTLSDKLARLSCLDDKVTTLASQLDGLHAKADILYGTVLETTSPDDRIKAQHSLARVRNAIALAQKALDLAEKEAKMFAEGNAE